METVKLIQNNKLIKKITSDITNISPSFFHKIDLRLRPDLGGANIVTDLDSAIDYYSSVGRNWERLAYHRSNFICGNILLYNSFLNSIKSFLFRRSFDFYALDEIKKLFERKANFFFFSPDKINTIGSCRITSETKSVSESELPVQTPTIYSPDLSRSSTTGDL